MDLARDGGSGCAANLDHARALRDAGKFVLAFDYADDPELVALARRRYAEGGFAGYVGPVGADAVGPRCG